MRSILSVEDSPDCQRLISRSLGPTFQVSFASTVSEASHRLASEVPDLVLIDLSLPDGDGFQLCSALQRDERTREVPILLLSARTEIQEKVLGFALGADDYLEKPFDPLELRARIEARLKKKDASAERGTVLRRGRLRIDIPLHRVTCTGPEGESDVALTASEFRLLSHLAAHEDRVFSRGQLVSALWRNVVVTERTIDTHVCNLRKKLGPLGRYVKSVRGVGFRLSRDGD